MTSTSEEPIEAGQPGWALPALAAGCGWSSVPMLFLAPTSFVLAALLVVVGGLAGLAVATDRSAELRRRGVAGLGLLGAGVAVGLAVVPFLAQE
jgi:hypothetical protein